MDPGLPVAKYSDKPTLSIKWKLPFSQEILEINLFSR